MNAGTVEEIKSKIEALTEQFHIMSSKLYQQAAGQQGGAQGAGPQGFDPNNMGGFGGGFNPGQGGFNPGNMGGAGFNPGAGAQGGKTKDDTVVDADFEVVDDK
jgi:molecular chaperone DnaK